MIQEFELKSIDRHFANFVCTLKAPSVCNTILPDVSGLAELASPGEKKIIRSGLLHLAALLVSNVTGNGHVCLDLKRICGQDILLDGISVTLPPYNEMILELVKNPVVGIPGMLSPLVLDAEGRLYLYRYWRYEQQLADAILEKVNVPPRIIDDTLCQDGISRLFMSSASAQADWQQVAALVALRKNFCILSGGPGTGKTSTVVKILALALEQSGTEKLCIALAAPTGKSAARLKESITRMKESLDCNDSVKEAIPVAVSTVHRLLGSIRGSSRFRHNENNRLPHDLVIIDEASMVALPLMAKLITALKPDARLILLGDRDQLSSVEAGAVLGDLCGNQQREPFSLNFSTWCRAMTGFDLKLESDVIREQPLSDCLVILKDNYRFSADSGIGALAGAINQGDGERASALLDTTGAGDVCWYDLVRHDQLSAILAPHVLEGYRPYLQAETVEEALTLFEHFRFICVLRNGSYGVEGINRLAEETLASRGLIFPADRWYKGRPVLITVNEYALQLYNGDVGIVWPDQDDGGRMKVFFYHEEKGVRSISPLRLPQHETVYAMTVHKSQGSEFNSVYLVMPEHDTPVITRELIYTGVTRARKKVAILGKQELFVAAVGRTVQRASGLMNRLWGAV